MAAKLPKIPCKIVLWYAKNGTLTSSLIRRGVNNGSISEKCGREALRQIHTQITMNGRRRRR